MSSENTMSDYANLAFNPYAISTDDLTIDSGDLKGGRSMENHGFYGNSIGDSNSHYEGTSEIVKPKNARLTTTGRRKKENMIYEEAVFSKENKAKGRVARPNPDLPPRAMQDFKDTFEKNHGTQWRIPFIVLCILVLLCLAGSALGFLAFVENRKCSCEREAVQQRLNSAREQPDASEATPNTENLTKTITQLAQTLGNLQTRLDRLETEQKIQLVNISGQMGSRGYNGSQGIRGPPGTGNLSLCQVISKRRRQLVSQRSPASATKTQITVKERMGYKVMAAVCTTEEHYGAQQTVLSVSEPVRDTYTCTCAGVSQAGQFPPEKANGERFIECVIVYWECPIIT